MPRGGGGCHLHGDIRGVQGGAATLSGGGILREDFSCGCWFCAGIKPPCTCGRKIQVSDIRALGNIKIIAKTCAAFQQGQLRQSINLCGFSECFGGGIPCGEGGLPVRSRAGEASLAARVRGCGAPDAAGSAVRGCFRKRRLRIFSA